MDLRTEVVQTLSQFKEATVSDALLKVAQTDAYFYNRHLAAASLAQRGDKRILKQLLQAIQTNDTEAEFAIAALGDLKDAEAVEPIVERLKKATGSWRPRRAAVVALEKIGGDRAVDGILGALRDKDETVRGEAAAALGRLKEHRSTQELIALLQDETRAVHSATTALGNIRDPKSVEALISSLNYKDYRIRVGAADALGKIGVRNNRVIESLLSSLDDKYAQASAARALKSLTGQDFGVDAKRWRQWWEKNQKDPQPIDAK
jgi:HEAT repeat protein